MKKQWYLLIGVLVIAFDQISKYLVRANMRPGDRIPVIGDWMSIYYVQNTGTAFSMFAGNRFVTIFLTSVLIFLCIVFVVKESSDGLKLIPTLFTFVAAGGISNMIDRLALGYVTDMISCWSFAVFNVADICITCGCILTMFALIFLYKDEDKTESGAEDPEDAEDSEDDSDTEIKDDPEGDSDAEIKDDPDPESDDEEADKDE